MRNGTWIPHYPSQVHSPGKLADFFPGQDAGRSWCYDVEIGAHQLIPTGVFDPRDREVERMLDHMEDVQFLADGWFDYPATMNEQDWFNLGGFSKVQPYYTRNCEIYALRDDVKPFVRSYFNALASLLNPEVLTLWEHFHHSGAWDKTHETGYFLHQTRTMLVTERGDELWLAPFITSNWLKDGQTLSVSQAPTRFGAGELPDRVAPCGGPYPGDHPAADAPAAEPDRPPPAQPRGQPHPLCPSQRQAALRLRQSRRPCAPQTVRPDAESGSLLPVIRTARRFTSAHKQVFRRELRLAGGVDAQLAQAGRVAG